MYLTIKIATAIILAVILGNGSVVLVNHLPIKWFEDWKDEKSDERVLPQELLDADNAGRQRISSSPWKYVFVSFFMVSGVYLAITTALKFEISTMILLFMLLVMAICDQLCKIVPDQLQILLIVSTLGFVVSSDPWWEPLAGAGIGLLMGAIELGLGILIYKKHGIGGADIKFFTIIGLAAGRRGVLVIFILTTLLLAIESIYLLKMKKTKKNDGVAMMPSAFIATTIYMLFLFNIIDIIHL